MTEKDQVTIAPEPEEKLPDIVLDAPPQKQQEAAPAKEDTSLRHELEAYRNELIARDQALRAAQQEKAQLQRQAQEAQGNVFDSQWHMYRNAIDARKSDIDAIRREKILAYQQGDFGAVAQLDERLADVTAEKKMHEITFAQLEQMRNQPQQTSQQSFHQVQQQQPQPQQQPAYQPQGDVVERRARASGPRAAEWIRAHPDLVRDENTWAKMTYAADYATRIRQLQPDSPEWLSWIESEIGVRGNSNNTSRMQPAAAPPSRTVMGSNGRSGPKTLTARQAAIAKDLGMTNLEYWEHLQGSIEDGSYNLPKDWGN